MNTKGLLNTIKKGLPLLALALAGMLLSACGLFQPGGEDTANTVTEPVTAVLQGVVIAEGRLEPADSVWLAFPSAGEVDEVRVDEGAAVDEGQTLAVLGNPQAGQAELESAQAQVVSARQGLDDLNENAALAGAQAYQTLVQAQQAAVEAQQVLADMDTQEYQDDIDEAWTKVQDAQDNLDDAQETYDKYADLDEDNTTRQNADDDLEDAQRAYDDAVREHDRLVYDLEQVRADAEQAQQTVDSAQQDYDDRQNGPDPDELALAQANLEAAQAQVTAAEQALALMSLNAPFDGTLTAVNVTTGQTVAVGEPVMRLADFSQWYVETTDLDEIRAAQIETGAPVTLTVDALPGLELSGTLERIDLDYTEKSGDVLYTAHIRLNESDPRLRWGMTVQVQFGE